MSDKTVLSLDDLEIIASVGPVNLAHLNERTQIEKRQQELMAEIQQLYNADLSANTDPQFTEYRQLAGRLLLLNDLIRSQLIHAKPR